MFLVLTLFCVCVFKGAPVAVGMSIDVASIDMVSEVNMVSCVDVTGLFLTIKGSLCSFSPEIQSQNFIIYNVNEVVINITE